jgi:hypothetical protein
MREGHENRTDLYEKTKAYYQNVGSSMGLVFNKKNTDLLNELASNTKLQKGHPDYDATSPGDRQDIENAIFAKHPKLKEFK